MENLIFGYTWEEIQQLQQGTYKRKTLGHDISQPLPLTEKEFWDAMRGDVISEQVGNYPYTSVFTTRYPKNEVGKIVKYWPDGKRWPVLSKYFIK